MFKEKKTTLQFNRIYFTCHKSETILFPPKKLIQKNLIQIEITSLSVNYENKKVTLKL